MKFHIALLIFLLGGVFIGVPLRFVFPVEKIVMEGYMDEYVETVYDATFYGGTMRFPFRSVEHDLAFERTRLQNCDMTFDGVWSSWLILDSCILDNCTIQLESVTLRLIDSTIKKSTFIAGYRSTVHIITGNKFVGYVEIQGSMQIWENGTNIGLENIHNT